MESRQRLLALKNACFAAKKAATFKKADWPPSAAALKNAYWFELSLQVRGRPRGLRGKKVPNDSPQTAN